MLKKLLLCSLIPLNFCIANDAIKQDATAALKEITGQTETKELTEAQEKELKTLLKEWYEERKKIDQRGKIVVTTLATPVVLVSVYYAAQWLVGK